MRTAQAAGLPVPRVINYGEHDASGHVQISILMTRMPGCAPFEELWVWFDQEERKTILLELKACLRTIRGWKSPWNDDERICSISGTSIRSYRVPEHKIGPCGNLEQFNTHLMKPAQCNYAKAFRDYEEDLAKTKPLLTRQHKVVFTHGDLSRFNLLVTYDGHLSAILDWEAAGWYPEYWESTTAWRFSEPGSWWFGVVHDLSEGKYLEELDGHVAAFNLTGYTMV